MNMTNTLDPRGGFRAAYLVFFQHTFVPPVFFGVRSQIRPCFRFLTSRSCIADMIANGYTDFNLADGRFWDSVNPETDILETAFPSFNRSGCTLETDPLWDLRYFRTDSDLSVYGMSVARLMEVFHPQHIHFAPPFIPKLGVLKICRNSIPLVQRNGSFHMLSTLLRQGLTPWTVHYCEDQSLTHFPLSVVVRKAIRLRATPLPGFAKNLSLRPKLRIHIYPYGLVTVSLVVSVSASEPLTTEDLIELQGYWLNPSSSTAGEPLFYGKAFKGTVAMFLVWVSDLVRKALLVPTAIQRASARSDLHTVVCLSRPVNVISTSERIGLLSREPDWLRLSDSFVSSYSSFFGRYAGEFVHASENHLLLCLDIFERKRKRKSRVRFHWNFVSIVQALSAKKLLCQELSARLMATLTHQDGVVDLGNDERRIAAWLEEAERWHRQFRPAYRKFYYEVGRVLRIEDHRHRLVTALGRSAEKSAERLRRQQSDYLLSCVAGVRWLLGETLVNNKHEWPRSPTPRETEATAVAIHKQIQEGISQVGGVIDSYRLQVASLIGMDLYETLSVEAREALLLAELILDMMHFADDQGPVVIEYGRAAELELNGRLLPRLVAAAERHLGKSYFNLGMRRIGPLHKASVTLGEAPYLFSDRWSDESTGQRYINKTPLRWARELFELVLGTQDVELDRDLERMATEVQTLASYRNRAVHTSRVGREEALRVRQWWSTARTVRTLILGLSRT